MEELEMTMDVDIERLMEEIDSKLRIHDDDDDDDTIELELRAKKKSAEPPTLEQLFRQKIGKYNRTRHSDLCTGIWEKSSYSPDADTLSELAGTIKYACDEYLNIHHPKGETFVLLPDGNKGNLSVGMDVYLLTESFEDCAFLIHGLPVEEYAKHSPVLAELSMSEKADTLAKAKRDPEGFALWSQLGGIKREDTNRSVDHKRLIEERAKEFMKRIPEGRNDLYGALERALNRFRHCCNNEKADYAEVLLSMERLMTMMLCNSQGPARYITVDDSNRLFPNASIKETALAGKRRNNVPPNILIVGRDSDNAITAIREAGCIVQTIDMSGIDGNDYLLGDQMSYYCSGIGRLIRAYEEAKTLSSVIVLESVDLMGTTMRSSNPLYGVVSILRKHRIRDFHLRDFDIDASRTQFICQVNDLESCPPLLLGEMDIIIEL